MEAAIKWGEFPTNCYKRKLWVANYNFSPENRLSLPKNPSSLKSLKILRSTSNGSPRANALYPVGGEL